jgi:hypothetical protein
MIYRNGLIVRCIKRAAVIRNSVILVPSITVTLEVPIERLFNIRNIGYAVLKVIITFVNSFYRPSSKRVLEY